LIIDGHTPRAPIIGANNLEEAAYRPGVLRVLVRQDVRTGRPTGAREVFIMTATQPSDRSLIERIEELEAQLASKRRRRPGRGVMAIIVAAVLVLMPALVLASHQYTDVPDSNIYHNNIGAITDAGIAGGCGTNLYCPGDPVTRGQMAAFMQRGLGRSAKVEDSVAGATDSFAIPVASLTIKSGGQAGKTGFLVVTASGTLYTTSAGVCPCTLAVRPSVDGSEPLLWEFETITDVASPYGGGSFRMGSASNSWVFPVSSGASHTVTLLAALDTTSGSVTLQGNLSAVYTPFGSQGTSAAGPEEAPSATNGLAGN
jgi:hypothetical protein